MAQTEEHIAVKNFREYLRIKTVQPHPDYEGATRFLRRMAHDLDLPFKVLHITEGKPICIITWEGTSPNEKSIMLNSHTDVVPVSEDKWTHDPFAAIKLENGDIVARGSQDMKCVGIQYLEAIRILKSQGKTPTRTLHLTYVPDEEIGGDDGMRSFVLTPEFAALNVGFSLDEGLANTGDNYKAYYGERAPWWIRVKATGVAGHGSRFLEPTATVRLMNVVNRLLAFRESEKNRLKYGCKENGEKLTLGDVTSTNLTMLKAGVQINVVPEDAEAAFDIRVSPTVNLDAFKAQLEEWCSDDGIELVYVQQFMGNSVTDTESMWWDRVRNVAKKRGVELEPEIFPAATDSRFIRQIGIPAIGISPIRRTPVLLHDHNEFLNEGVYLEGLEFYVELVEALWVV